MREVTLQHSEVLNTTEIILVFTTKFNRKEYAAFTVINTAAPSKLWDEQVEAVINTLQNMSREDARNATEVK